MRLMVDHDRLKVEWQPEIASARKQLLIPPRWKIDLEIRCPNDMPEAQGSMSWDYLPNARYLMRLRCDLDPHTARYVIAHELMEAIMAPYADFAEGLIAKEKSKRVRDLLIRQHGDIRNEHIEWVIPLITGLHRP